MAMKFRVKVEETAGELGLGLARAVSGLLPPTFTNSGPSHQSLSLACKGVLCRYTRISPTFKRRNLHPEKGRKLCLIFQSAKALTRPSYSPIGLLLFCRDRATVELNAVEVSFRVLLA